jgi:hypothetical protein
LPGSDAPGQGDKDDGGQSTQESISTKEAGKTFKPIKNGQFRLFSGRFELAIVDSWQGTA